jgi:trimeric autotransporter adhesin
MKPITRSKSLALTAATVAGFLLLPSWSPPSPDLKVQVGTQTNATNFRGFVGGYDNVISHSSFDSGFGTVLGNNNTAFISAGVVAGSSNTIASGSTSWAQTLQSSGVFGNSNTIPQSRSNLLVAGSQNTVNATHSIVAGNTNTINGVPIGAAASNSAAIGQLNNVASSVGWAVGYQNTASGTRSLALGTGTRALNPDSTALGRHNVTMATNDVLAIGSGSDANNRFTALRVTDDGGVILGRAQGDISMGDYQ